MTQILPWVAVALAAAALLAREGSRASSESNGPTPFWKDLAAHRSIFVAMATLAVIALVSGWRWDEKLPGCMATSWGLTLGLGVAVVAYLAELSSERALVGAAVPMALGLAAVGITEMGAKDSVLNIQLGFAAGSALGAWMLSLRTMGERAWWPAIASAFGSAALAANFLGSRWPGEKVADSGLAFGLVAVLSGIIAVGLSRAIQRERGADTARAGLYLVIAAALVLLGGTVVGRRYLFLDDAWHIFGAAVLAALVVNWFLPDSRQSSNLRFLIAAVVWIALATIAFGLRKGYGMSISLMGGMGMMLLIGNRRALMTMGPVLALVMFRVFREMHSEAYRAIDIGQHYAIIGLLLGAALPLIPIEWSRILRPASSGSVAGAAFLWVVLLLGILPAAAVLLGPKGLVGFVAGLGIGSVIEGMRGSNSLHVLSLGAGLAGAGSLIYGWLGDYLDKTREAKLGVLYGVVGVLVVVALIIAAMTPRQEEEIEPAV